MRSIVSIVLLLSLGVVAASAQILTEAEYEDLFLLWTKTHHKHYADAQEFATRFQIFKANRDFIFRHNAKPNVSYTMAMNQFGDLTNEEFRSLHGYRGRSSPRSSSPRVFPPSWLPSSVNWTAAGKVTAVQNQGQCGSCWAFSAIAALSSAHAIKYKVAPVLLSAQELMDCSGSAGNEGCNGGEVDPTYKWIQSVGGLCSAADYPYSGQDGQCMMSKCKPQFNFTASVDLPANSESQMQAACARVTLQVVVDASGQGWQFYDSGILDDPNCYTSLDHTALVVGYGELSGKAYWLLQNSWGPDWGMNGYIMLARNVADPKGMCGIAMEPSYIEA